MGPQPYDLLVSSGTVALSGTHPGTVKTSCDMRSGLRPHTPIQVRRGKDAGSDLLWEGKVCKANEKKSNHSVDQLSITPGYSQFYKNVNDAYVFRPQLVP